MKRIVGVFWLLLLMAVPAFATVSVETTRVAYTCNGVLTSYAYPFKVLADADLLVVKKATATSAETTLTLNTDYTVTGAGTSGGNVVLTAGSKCGSGYTLTILRDMAATQTTDYVDGEAFSAVSIEDALDKVTLIQQQQREQIGRAPKLPETSTITDISLPNPTANNYIGWNAGATGLENKSSPVITTATQYEVDALVSYGSGTSFTQATIEAALTAIGTTNKVTLLLRPGNWVISTALAFPANVTVEMPAGAYFSGAAVTAGTITLAGNKEVYPEWFNVTGTADNVPIQAAASSLTSGGVLKLTGAYTGTKQTTVTLLSDTYIQGNGIGKTVLTDLMFSATSKNDLKFSDFSMLTTDTTDVQWVNFIQLANCTNITIKDMLFNGLGTSDWKAARGIWAMGTDNLNVSDSRFTNVNYPLYLDTYPTSYSAPSGGTRSKNTVVDKCYFEMTNFVKKYAGNSHYSGIYNFYADNTKVTNSHFLNFVPESTDADPLKMANGVYDGDGTGSDGLYVSGCTFINDYVATNNYMSAINSTIAKNVTFVNNNVSGCGVNIYAPASTAIVKGNNIRSGRITVMSNPYTAKAIIEGNTVDSAASYGIQVGQLTESLGVDAAIVSNNIVNKSGLSGIRLWGCTSGTIIGNRIIDANTGNSATSGQSAGIVIYNTYEATIIGNYIANETASGKAKYGIDFIDNRGKYLYFNNNIKGMATAPMLNGYTAVPDTGTWSVGERVANMTPASGQPKAWSCTVAGTFGTGTEAGTTTSGSPIVTVASTTGFAVNDLVDATAGFAVLTNLRIISMVTDTSITVDRNANASGAATLAHAGPTFVSEGNL